MALGACADLDSIRYLYSDRPSLYSIYNQIMKIAIYIIVYLIIAGAYGAWFQWYFSEHIGGKVEAVGFSLIWPVVLPFSILLCAKYQMNPFKK